MSYTAFKSDHSKAVLFCGSFVFLCLVFLKLSRLFTVVTCWERADSWLLLVMSIVFLLLSHVVSRVRCVT